MRTRNANQLNNKAYHCVLLCQGKTDCSHKFKIAYHIYKSAKWQKSLVVIIDF